MHLKQFVPSLVCLSCEGCCRFHDERSPWRPKVGPGEKHDFTAALALDSVEGGMVDGNDYVTAVPAGNLWRCRFLEDDANTCGIYAGRPFECRFYPFLLVKDGGRFLVALHLSCPFAQKFYGKKEADDHVAYLKDVFSRPAAMNFLRDNPELFSDYGRAEQEWVSVFEFRMPGDTDGR